LLLRSSQRGRLAHRAVGIPVCAKVSDWTRALSAQTGAGNVIDKPNESSLCIAKSIAEQPSTWQFVGRVRDLGFFDLAIDVKLRVTIVSHGDRVVA
jgi:hypothetical protein